MEIPNNLECVFSAQVDEHHGSYVIEVPKNEISVGPLRTGETYQVGVLSTKPEQGTERKAELDHGRRQADVDLPVTEGDQRDVVIEDIGEKGDGIARIERGFVIIIPETNVGEQVTIEVTDVKENVAFAKVIHRNEE